MRLRESRSRADRLVVLEGDGKPVLVAQPTRQAVPCPECGELNNWQHSSYLRRPLDLP